MIDCRANAERFSNQVFRDAILHFVNNVTTKKDIALASQSDQANAKIIALNDFVPSLRAN